MLVLSSIEFIFNLPDEENVMQGAKRFVKTDAIMPKFVQSGESYPGFTERQRRVYSTTHHQECDLWIQCIYHNNAGTIRNKYANTY